MHPPLQFEPVSLVIAFDVKHRDHDVRLRVDKDRAARPWMVFHCHECGVSVQAPVVLAHAVN